MAKVGNWYIDKIDGCQEFCDVPAGFAMTIVPPSRHAWSDIVRCPNCGLTFLLHQKADVACVAGRSL